MQRSQYGGHTPVVPLAMMLAEAPMLVRVWKIAPLTEPGVSVSDALTLLLASPSRIITLALAR